MFDFHRTLINKLQTTESTTATDGGSADNAWSNYLPENTEAYPNKLQATGGTPQAFHLRLEACGLKL
jgi:hypothetical protein